MASPRSLITKYKEKDLTDEEKFVQNCAGNWNLGCGATKAAKGQGENVRKASYGCHAWMSGRYKKDIHIVTQYKGVSEEAQAFLKWITKPDGPFKKLWEVGQGAIILDKGGKFPVAISLDEPQSLFKDYALVMGLMIISRVPIERESQMKSWYSLVTKYGMEPALAYYMSHNIQMATGNVGGELAKIDPWVCHGTHNWTGGHEIFNENASYFGGMAEANKRFGTVDVKAFSTGDYLDNSTIRQPSDWYSSRIWNRYGNKKFDDHRLSSFPFQMYSKTYKSGFGQMNAVSGEDMHRVIKDFTAFVEKRYEKA